MKIKQVANISAGYPFRGKIYEAASSSIRVIQMKNVSLDTGIDWEASIKTKLTGKGEPEWLKPGDILFIARGSHNYAVLVDQIAHEIQAVASPHFYILRCTSEQVLPSFLVWLLNQKPSQRYYQREAEGSVTKSIRRSVLEATPIAIPSLAKQHSIIQFAETFKQQQQLFKQLNSNGFTLMDAIATDLLYGSN